MYPVSLRDEIRTWVLIQGKSQRAAARHFDVSRHTVAKLLQEEPAAQERRYQRQKEATLKTPARDLCAGYLGHPFLENNGFCERMSQVASIALLSSHLYFIHTITDTYQESTIGVSSRVPAAWLLC